MKFTDLSIDHFGALSRFQLPEIASGLNVVHGPNGSGKTTLLQFIRGVFGGFAEARRRQLIPPVSGGVAGGTVGVEWGSRRLAVIRHNRPDDYETLAINVRQGMSDEGQSLRKHLEAFDDERLSVLFTAGSFDANSVEALMTLARQDGIDLSTIAGNEGPLSARLAQLYAQRAALQSELNETGRTAFLRQRIDELTAEGLEIHHAAEARRARLSQQIADLDARRAELLREINALHLGWQALHSDLTELQCRLWSARTHTVVDVVYVQESIPPAHNPRLPEVEDIDRRIEHLRIALKDLAATRSEVTSEAVANAGADVPSREVFVARQRESLRIMQMQLQVLQGTVQWLESARSGDRCVCQTLDERLGSVTDELRRQVELSCQELSRQQSAWRLAENRTDRAAIDDCEAGMLRQLEWLRQRREELLEDAANPVLSRLAHTITAERQYCGCPAHTATTRATTPRVVTRRTMSERSQVVSAARPEDEARHAELADQAHAMWLRWQSALSRSSGLVHERRRLVDDLDAIDPRLQLADCEGRLAEAREQLAAFELRHGELQSLESEIRTIEGQIVRDRSSRVITEASEYLELLTLGRYHTLRTMNEGLTLQIVAENGSPYVASALSRGTLFQVALALRVALVDEYARRGIEFPLVLDDVLVDSDEHRLEAAAHLLSCAAERGRQILFLTCQDHLVSMLEERGALIHALPGSVRMRTSRPVFIPAVAPVALAEPIPEPSPIIAPVDVPLVTSTIEIETEPADQELVDDSSVEDEALFDIDRPAANIPSLSGRMAALLVAEGIRTMGQVIDLDDVVEAPLFSRLSISRQDLVTWRAEAILLCTVSGLSRDNARLLAAIGVHHADDLIHFSPAELSQRILRFRGSTPQVWHAWMRDRNSWPTEEEVAIWIHNARTPRPLRSRLLLSAESVEDGEDGPDDDGPQPANEQGGQPRHRRRRGRGGRSRTSTGTGFRNRGSASADTNFRFYLTIDSPIVDAPSIGPKMARLLNRAGVQTVSHLLQRVPEELAETMSERSITAETILAWQQQSRLMCDLPELRGHDAQLLVACGFTSVDHLAEATTKSVLSAVVPFAETKAGQRMLRSSSPPEAEEVDAWLSYAGSLRGRRAA